MRISGCGVRNGIARQTREKTLNSEQPRKGPQFPICGRPESVGNKEFSHTCFISGQQKINAPCWKPALRGVAIGDLNLGVLRAFA